MFKIVVDSSANFTPDEAKKLGLEVVPLTISFGDETYLDGVEISIDDFYEKLTRTKVFPKSAQPSVAQFDEVFAKAKKEKQDVLVITISTALSGTYGCATLAKEQGGYENVFIIDSLCTTVMIRMLVIEAMRHQDKSAKEVTEILKEFRKRIKLFAMVDTLEYLYKGGRLKRSAAILGGILNIKPLIYISDEGKVELCGKQLGVKSAMRQIRNWVKSDDIDKNYPVMYVYTKNTKNSDILIDIISDNPESDKKNAINVCPVIGTHIGPNAGGIAYIIKK